MPMILLTVLLAASGTAAAATPPADAADVMRCVKEDITGSIARKRKVCHTVREWEDIRRSAQQETERFMKPGFPPESRNPDKWGIEKTY